jgi:hypothetical protein
MKEITFPFLVLFAISIQLSQSAEAPALIVILSHFSKTYTAKASSLRRAAHCTVIAIRDVCRNAVVFQRVQVTRRCRTLSTKRRNTLKSYNQTGKGGSKNREVQPVSGARPPRTRHCRRVESSAVSDCYEFVTNSIRGLASAET